MAMTINVNGGSKLQLGAGTPLEASQQLSTVEVDTDASQTDVRTYGGATRVSGQPMRTIRLSGYQDWNAVGSVCRYLEENQGVWVPIVYDQYGGGSASQTNPIVTGEVLCTAPKRGGSVDDPETFDLTFGIRDYAVDHGA